MRTSMKGILFSLLLVGFSGVGLAVSDSTENTQTSAPVVSDTSTTTQTPAPAPVAPADTNATTQTPATAPAAPMQQDQGAHDGLMQQLNLTADQQSKMKQLMQEYGPKMSALHDKMLENRKSLQALSGQTGADADAKVNQIATSQGDLLKQVIIMRNDIQNKINAILTPEQRQKLESIKDSYKQDQE